MRASFPVGCLLLGACSLVVGATPPECTEHAQCEILNELEGIPTDACTRYQCSSMTSACELSVRDLDGDGLVPPECVGPGLEADCNDEVPMGPEVCNGADDDCDGAIDESVTPGESEVMLSVGDVSGLGHVGHGVGAGALALAHSDGARAPFGIVGGGGVVGPADLSTLRAADLTSTTDASLVPGCHSLRTDGSVQSGSCNVADVGLAVTAEHVLIASVSTDGCAEGQLRVGHVERSDGARGGLIERGPARRSNSFFGIDSDPSALGGRLCTGASRASGTLGAARPGLAALTGTLSDQALLAYLADTVERGECGGSTVDVEALALFVQADTFGAEYRWVTASNEAQPQVLGQTTGGGTPGVAAWESTGYLVGFGEAGGIRLVFVEMPAEPPAYDGAGMADDRAGLETPPLSVHDVGSIPTGGAPDDVAIAAGSIRPGGRDFGLAWREGCGSGAESIHFRQVRITTAFAIDDPASFDTVRLTATTDAGPPAIAYRFAGLLALGIDRPDGRPTGADDNDGGWMVAWEDASEPDPGPANDRRILATRVSEADGSPLGVPVPVHAPGDRERRRPALYRTADDEIHFAYLQLGEGSGFRGGALTCRPAEP